MTAIRLIEPVVRVRRCAELTTAEREQVGDLLRVVFTADEPGHDWCWAIDDWDVMVWVGDRLVSRIGIVERIARVGEREVRLAGVGGVGTLPGERRHGYAALALREAERFLRDELGAEFGLLICAERMIPYYERFGWRVAVAPLFYEQPTGRKVLRGPTMVLTGTKADWPDGVIDLCGLPW
jgi:GNAT superfamily N-acetyltransferase